MSASNTPLAVNKYFILKSWGNAYGHTLYNLFVGERYLMCLGIDGHLNEVYPYEKALEDATALATRVLSRFNTGKNFRRGSDEANATEYLKDAMIPTSEFVSTIAAKLDLTRVSLAIANTSVHGDHQVELRDLKNGNSLIWRDWDFSEEFRYNMWEQCKPFKK